MTTPHAQIRPVAWSAIQAWIYELATAQDQWDCIVGISRGGIPLAVTLSYCCDNMPLEFVYRSHAPGSRTPFYIYGEDRQERLRRNRKSFQLTTGGKYRRPLVVDDVATFGDTLAIVNELLSAEGATTITFATYAVDLPVLSREHPELAPRINHAIAVDNSSVWLSFPWQRY